MRLFLIAACAATLASFAPSAYAGCVDGYAAEPAPKALAMSTNGHCGFAGGRVVSTVRDARTLAMSFCKKYGGNDCRVTKEQK